MSEDPGSLLFMVIAGALLCCCQGSNSKGEQFCINENVYLPNYLFKHDIYMSPFTEKDGILQCTYKHRI